MSPVLNVKTLYEQVKDYICKKIESGKFKTNDKIPSEYDLAEELQVNRVTVNKAITSLVHEGLLYRIRGSGTFVKEKKFIDSQALKTIVMLIPERFKEGNFALQIILGMEQVISDEPYLLRIQDFPEKDASSHLESLLARKKINGLIMMSYTIGEQVKKEAGIINRLIAEGIPVVTIDNYREGADYVAADNFQSSYQITKRILEMGRRKIATMTRKEVVPMQDRLKGVQKALRENRVPVDERLIFECVEPATPSEGYRGAEEILKFKPDAIFTANASLAAGAIRKIEELHLKIPEDIFVCGFDFDDSAPFLHSIPYLTACQDLDEMGRRAMELLMDRIEGRLQTKEPQKIYVPAPIQVKE